MVGIASSPRNVDRQLTKQLQSIKEAMEIGLGNRGNPIEKFVTVSDLLDMGLAEVIGVVNGSLVAGGNLVGSTVPPNLAVPPAPTGLVVTGGFSYVYLRWDNPNSLYSNHSHTLIYRATDNNVANAVQIGQVATGYLYADVEVTQGVDYYYWIKFVSTSSVEGPFNSSSGTVGARSLDPSEIIALLTDQINSTQLAQSLRDEIDSIAGIAQSVIDEIADRSAADDLLQGQIDDLIINNDSSVAAVSARVTTLETRVDDVDGGGTTLETFANSYFILLGQVNHETTGLSAVYAESQLIQQRLNDVDGGGITIENLAENFNTLQADVEHSTTGLAATYNAGQLIQQRINDVYGDASAVTLENFSADYASLSATITHGATGLAATYNKAVTIEQRIDNTGGAGVSIENIATLAQSLDASVNDGVNGLSATYSQVVAATARIDDVDGQGATLETMATFTTELSSVLNDDVATLQEAFTTIDGLSAQWEIKAQVGDLVGGVGFFNDGVDTYFLINAGVFAILEQDDSLLSPFIVQGGITYINTGMFAEASIGDAAIGSLAVDKLIGFDAAFILASIGTGNITNAYIGDTIQSDIFSTGPGGSGWRISKSLGIEAHNIIIYDDSGNIILSSGGLTPQPSSWLTDEVVSDSNPIDTSNFSTFIDAAIINNLLAGQVDVIETLNLQGQTVTITESAQSSTESALTQNYGDTQLSKSIVFSNATEDSAIKISMTVSARADLDGDTASSGNYSWVEARLLRGATVLESWEIVREDTVTSNDHSRHATVSINYADKPGAGTFTYHFQVRYNETTGSIGGGRVYYRYMDLTGAKR